MDKFTNLIFLMGFMGSGKSTVGRLLSEALDNTGYIDMDTYIESSENQSIRQIFDTVGETHFRHLEHKYLKEIIQTKEKFIVALGGGTPCYMDNLSVLHPFPSFYLKVGVDRLVGRLYDPDTQRPLLQGLSRTQLHKYIATMVRDRERYYSQAQYTIRAYDKPDRVARQILTILDK